MIDGVLLADAETRAFRTANRAIALMTGYTVDELCSMRVDDIHPAEALPSILERFGKMTAESERSILNAPVLRKDGTIFYADINAAPIEIKSGVFLMGVFRDASDRRRLEEALLQKTEELEHYFLRSLDLLCIADTEGYFRRLNPEWERTLGYAVEELVGRKFLDFVHKDDVEPTLEAISRLSRQEEVLNFVNRYRHKDGSWRWIEWRSFSRGNQIYSVARDITERKRVEESLRENEQLLLLSQKITLVGHYVFEEGADRWISSPMMDEIFGIDEKFKKNIDGWLSIVHPEDRQMMADYLSNDVLKNGNPFNKQYRIVRKNDHAERWVHGLGTLEFDSDGLPTRMFGTIQDVTERKLAEANYLKAEKLESIGLLAGGIAHDFNNLLSGIFGNIDLALADVSTGRTREAVSFLEKSMNVLDRACDLTRQLLTFSKGGAPIKREGDIADTVKETVLFALSGSNVKADIFTAADVWKCEFDPHQIGQVIDNMIINAKQAMPSGGEVKVRVENIMLNDRSTVPLNPGRYVRITISDQGIGIMEEHLSKVFDPFFSTKQTGSGLGLATSWSVIRRHDGSIEVESAPGKGATFRIYLPAAQSRATSSSHVVAEEKPKRFTGHVLVMDDEAYICDVARQIFSTLGCTVEVAREGEEAISAVMDAREKGQPFHTAILDLTIPGGMGGKEAAIRIRRIDPSIRIIASSGYADDPAMGDPRNHGFDASLSKPYKMSDAVRALEMSERNVPYGGCY